MSPKEVTADFAYVRLHGPGGAYQGYYGRPVLTEWAETFLKWVKESREVYCYFDNDEMSYAAKNAAELEALVSEIEK